MNPNPVRDHCRRCGCFKPRDTAHECREIRKIRDYYAEEVAFLTSCGESPRVILERLGVTASALNRALYREGRNDLARMFGGGAFIPRVKRKGGACPVCGERVWKKGARCRAHELERRWGKKEATS